MPFQEAKASQSKTQASGLYQIRNLQKVYRVGSVDVPALRGVNLDIPEGKLVALEGPSGSGKSTLLNTLGLLETPTEGELRFLGHVVDPKNEVLRTRLRRDCIGFIFQNFNLVPVLSARENVEYALSLESKITRQEIHQRAEQILKAVGLEKFMHHRPSELSGGQRQRVAIARALVKRPRVILADEPTANLDSKTASQIIDLIHELKESLGTTIIMATHDPLVAQQTELKIRIKDGVIE